MEAYGVGESSNCAPKISVESQLTNPIPCETDETYGTRVMNAPYITPARVENRNLRCSMKMKKFPDPPDKLPTTLMALSITGEYEMTLSRQLPPWWECYQHTGFARYP